MVSTYSRIMERSTMEFRTNFMDWTIHHYFRYHWWTMDHCWITNHHHHHWKHRKRWIHYHQWSWKLGSDYLANMDSLRDLKILFMMKFKF